MHVVQLLPALDSGGVERGTIEIARALVSAGHRATVISAGGRQVPQLLKLGADHLHCAVGAKAPETLFRSVSLRRLLTHLDPDVVHVRSRLPAWVLKLAFAGRRRPFRTVSTLHGLNSVSRYSSVMLRADVVIAVSETCARYWRDHYPGPLTEKLHVIERGVDADEFPYGYTPSKSFSAGLRQSLGIARDTPLWCLPGRMVRSKGHLDLIPVLQAVTDANVLIPGEGPDAFSRELRSAAQQAGVLPRLHFLGHRQDVRDILAVSDIVFSISHKPESFGRTTAEALALGRPVIGYAHGGVEEILANVFPDGLVSPCSTGQLTDRAVDFTQRRPSVRRHHRYRLQDMCDATLAVYERLSRRRPPCQ